MLDQYLILEKKNSGGKKEATGTEGGEEDEEEDEEEALVCRVYFWQGRDSSKMSWPQFSLRYCLQLLVCVMVHFHFAAMIDPPMGRQSL